VTDLISVNYTRRGSHAVGFGDSVEELLADALAEGCTLATVGPRRRGAPRFHAHDGSAWREIGADEFEKLRGIKEDS
jgi:hypothetical protein